MTGFSDVCSRSERTSGRIRAAFADFLFASRLRFGPGVRRIAKCTAFCGVVHHAELSYDDFVVYQIAAGQPCTTRCTASGPITMSGVMTKFMTKKLVWISTFLLWYWLTLVGTFLLWFMPMGFIVACFGNGPGQYRTWGVFEYAETGYFYISESIYSCFWTWPDTLQIFPKPLCLTFSITLLLWGGTVVLGRRLTAKRYL